jgi:hypothetical protein
LNKKFNNKNEGEIMQKSKLIIPFYTQERWQNWIDQVKESGFKLEDQEKGAIFVYMTDDVILACLKVIAKYDKKLISREDALKHITEIKEMVLKKINPISDDIDIMFESTQSSLMSIFVSCEYYLKNGYQKIKSFGKLIKSAVQAEKEDSMGVALGIIAEIGANIIGGGKLKDKDFDNVSDGLVAEWLDGIDSISAAMIGDTSYKDDEPDEGD